MRVFTKATAWKHRDRLALAGILVVLAVAPARATAQRAPLITSVSAGSELERYVRVLGLVGLAPVGQWTVRAFGPSEIAALAPTGDHPWRRRMGDRMLPTTQPRQALLSPAMGVVYNSSAPFGFNDGPVWAGKGLTVEASGGASISRGPLYATLEPVAFFAQNADFRIADNALTGRRQFADFSMPNYIDRPQRFGSSSYGRIDPGESELRLQAFGLSAGVSTRAEVWGPANDHPVILGNNAGGIPRLFAGTSAPAGLGWLTVHGRVIWAQLNESAYGADSGAATRHFATGVAGSVGIKRLPGLEIGASRFFHTTWPAGGLRNAPWLRVIQAFINTRAADSTFGYNPDNQLASAYLRIAPPGHGFEVYGEYGREDRNASFRDVFLEPDHIAAYMLGLSRAWSRPEAGRITVLRGEILNSRISHLQQQRPQSPWYTHGAQLHGHTQRGQVLGSEGAFGGGAAVLAIDRYSASGRATVRWDRIVHATPLNAAGLPIPEGANVTHALSYERSIFTARGEITASGAIMKEFNRHFTGDAVNAKLEIAYRLVR